MCKLAPMHDKARKGLRMKRNVSCKAAAAFLSLAAVVCQPSSVFGFL